jgi:hypothetical protein
MSAFRMNPLLMSIPALVVASVCDVGWARQMQSVPEYWAITTQTSVLRSGDSERFYKIADLPTGTFLKVDGESQAWSRVSFPPNVACVVRVEDVKVEGSTVKVTQATKLRALNAVQGYVASWKSILDVPVDTTLTLIKEEREGDGPVVGYRVSAPDAARAFVESRALRRASESEVQAHIQKAGIAHSTPTATPAVAPAVTPGATSGTPIAQPVSGGTPTLAPTLDLTQPMSTNPTTTPGANPGTAPTSAPTAAVDPSSTLTPATPEVTAAVPAEDSSFSRNVSTLSQLDAAFREVWSQPVMTAELDEIHAEYRKFVDGLGDSMPKTRERIESRIKAIEVRQQFRETARKMEDDRAKIDSQKSEIQKLVQDWEARRVYTIVGELQPSTVYDGKRLPQMFRVTAVGGPSRTLGYIKGDEKFNLERMVGTVVGVIGEAELDRSLKLNVITPVRVDQLKGVGRPVGQ